RSAPAPTAAGIPSPSGAPTNGAPHPEPATTPPKHSAPHGAPAPHDRSGDSPADDRTRRPEPERPHRMLLDQQIGVRVYQFIVDRLEERRRDKYPNGREEYEADWTAAHNLEKDFATAVHAANLATAEQLL